MIDISSSLEKFPEFLSTQDLVDLGIYASMDSAYQARAKGYGPPFIKLNHKIIYSKKIVIEWLESKLSDKEQNGK